MDATARTSGWSLSSPTPGSPAHSIVLAPLRSWTTVRRSLPIQWPGNRTNPAARSHPRAADHPTELAPLPSRSVALTRSWCVDGAPAGADPASPCRRRTSSRCRETPKHWRGTSMAASGSCPAPAPQSCLQHARPARADRWFSGCRPRPLGYPWCHSCSRYLRPRSPQARAMGKRLPLCATMPRRTRHVDHSASRQPHHRPPTQSHARHRESVAGPAKSCRSTAHRLSGTGQQRD